MVEEIVKVPDIGDFDAVEIIEVLVSVGDSVEAETPLITLESDKATMEVPAPSAGVVKSLMVAEGDKVAEGAEILVLESAADASSSTDTASSASASDKSDKPDAPDSSGASDTPAAASKLHKDVRSAPPSNTLPEPDQKAFVAAHAGPSLRRFARELGVDLSRVTGSGRKGRIVKDDVKNFVKQVMQSGAAPAAAAPAGAGLPQQPDVDFSKFGEVERFDLPRIRKISAQHLHKNWLLIPHVTQHDEADITEIETFRKEQKGEAERQNVKLTMMSFLLKVCAGALRDFPELNSSLAATGDALILKKYINIGVAVDTPHGLVVPVIRDVDKKGLFALAKELGEVSKRARDGRLSPQDMQGGCFSISSLGGIGGTGFTPIVNAPEVAILGVSRAKLQPVWNGKSFEPRLVMPFALSYDHRVIDGAQAARVTTYMSELLSDIRRALL